MNLLDTGAANFFETTAGIAVITVALVAVLILIIELNYRLFAKYILDFIFAIPAVIICSPVLLVCAIISKMRDAEGEGVLEKTAYLGAKGKIIYVHSFRNIGKLKNLPQIIDVLCGKLSFVGIKLMSIKDGALISDEDMERFGVRPGLVCHFVGKGYPEMTYEEMFEMDAAYCKKREFFGDVWKILRYFTAFARGEGKSYLGETADKSYAQALLECGAITEEDVRRAEEIAESAADRTHLAKNFKSDRRNRR